MATEKSTSERNARLDALQVATKDWATGRTKYLNKQVALLKRILAGRPGSGKLANAAVGAANKLVVDEIDQFLK